LVWVGGFAGGIEHPEAAAGEQVGSHVAAGFGPFVGLLDRHGADESMMAGAVGMIPTMSVRLRISLLSCSWGLLDQICRRISRG
jgi:hypothetical protein